MIYKFNLIISPPLRCCKINYKEVLMVYGNQQLEWPSAEHIPPLSPFIKPHLNSIDPEFDLNLHNIAHTHIYQSHKYGFSKYEFPSKNVCPGSAPWSGNKPKSNGFFLVWCPIPYSSHALQWLFFNEVMAPTSEAKTSEEFISFLNISSQKNS